MLLLLAVSDAVFSAVLVPVVPPASTAVLELVLPGAVVLPISVVAEVPPAPWLVLVTSEWLELAVVFWAVLSLALVDLFVPLGSDAQDHAAQQRHQKNV